LTLPSFVLAQTDTIPVRELQAVQVNALKISVRNTSATPLQILTRADIDGVNSLSVGEAVRYFSGVQLKDYGGVGGLKTVNVRSMGTNHMAVFYDGIELGNAQNGQVDLGKFSLDNIDEISLYNGQKSTIFQPAKGFAAGSSLYLMARKPVFDSGQVSKEKLNLRTGSFGLFDPSLLWDYKISPKVTASLSTEYIQSSGRYKFNYTNTVYDTTAVRHNGDLNAFRSELGLAGLLNENSGWTAKAYYYQSARGLPGPVVSNKFDYSQRQWDRNVFVQSSFHQDIGRYSLLVSAKYANDYTRYLDPETVTTTGFLDNRFAQQDAYGSIANRYHINSFWNVALSGDYEWNKLDANIYHFAYPTRNSIFLNGATEFHFPTLDLQANLLGTFVNDHVRDFTPAGNKTEYTPAILLSWQFLKTESFHIRSFYKRIFRLPTFNDLYYTFVGNTLLRPEYATQYDIGLTYSKSYSHRLLTHLSFQADAYYNDVKDKIVAIPSANLFRWTMYNLGKVAIKGLALNLQTGWRISPFTYLTLTGSYTYEQALDKTGDYGYHNQIPYSPLNSGSVVSGLSWRHFSLNYSFIYTGIRYSEAANIENNRLQPWYTHDASVGYQVKPFKMTMEVNNLFNQYYDVVENFPMPGRSYRLTIYYAL
jgi:outer membrane cobalamin receptor